MLVCKYTDKTNELEAEESTIKTHLTHCRLVTPYGDIDQLVQHWTEELVMRPFHVPFVGDLAKPLSRVAGDLRRHDAHVTSV